MKTERTLVLVIAVGLVCTTLAAARSVFSKLEDERWKRTAFSDRKATRGGVCINGICDPNYPSQWHLHPTNFSSVHAEVLDVWSDGILGKDILISIVDDGVQVGHRDLAAGYVPSASWNFVEDSSDASPDADGYFHGTACAGVAGAKENNVCGVGVAPRSEFASVKVLGSKPMTASMEASALTYGLTDDRGVDVYSCSWGPSDDGFTMEALTKVVEAALELGVSMGRSGKGAVYVWAGGNGAANFDMCNMDGFVGSPYTIAVAAVGHNGRKSYYSEECTAILVSAPSSDEEYGITTTLGGEGDDSCRDDFGGTSSATPLVSGVVALILEARPELSWRDVQGVLVHSSAMVDGGDPSWVRNGAGLPYSLKYGFGLVSAARAVRHAQQWKLLEPRTYYTSQKLHFDTETTSFVSQVTVTEEDCLGTDVAIPRLEHVQLILDIRHVNRNQLRVEVESPMGTVSVFTAPRLVGWVPMLFFSEPSIPYEEPCQETGVGPPPEDGKRYLGAIVVPPTPDLCFREGTVTSHFQTPFIPIIRLSAEEQCDIVSQIRVAQSAGAEAVFVWQTGETPTLSGDSTDITIPSIWVSDMLLSFLVSEVIGVRDIAMGFQTRIISQPNYLDFPMSSVQFWDEDPRGEWQLRISDEYTQYGSGKMKGYELKLFGTGLRREYVYNESQPQETGLFLIFFIVGVILAALCAMVLGGLHVQRVIDLSPILPLPKSPPTYITDEGDDTASVQMTSSPMVTDDDDNDLVEVSLGHHSEAFPDE
mmetsp:Transcript_31363/g.87974  ORF Transcript_31363/g.87974 Transcript_31363/m.87974 type:complete len:763 (+) Transcript_31363:261-2549(+)|eukprot:CAMPEP_0119125524 /NCGR_PEP_ID=MMETSP1310-20130426/4756_1 /TAXON_ID=464262 /ORGANISM="Genus nov. species nov., Strain RCC2339" /LENGTH=762 /DNA_ID=CAMNT_0007115599 /DNA_START=228 /DNA_END=2516 /DNA_ORIENTATION=-